MGFADQLIARVTRRPPDFCVGGEADPYLRRWWVIPRNRWFNVYLHQFLRDDDDRALHDHPWLWCSVLLRGRYIEHTIAEGGIQRHRAYRVGSVRLHGPHFAHRLSLVPGETCWTLFITGPRLREWGFHCAVQGWVPWTRFTAARDGRPGDVGAGCDA